MKINKIEIKNFLMIKEIKLGGDGAPLSTRINLLMGKNSAGKTDIIKAIPAGLLGTTDTSIIRNGQDKAEIIIDLEKYRIHRTLTRKGQRLKIVSSDGSVNTTMQTYIDNMIGIADKDKRRFLFNPIDLVLSDNKAKYLQDMFRTEVTAADLKSGGIEKDVIARLDFQKDGLIVIKDAENIIYARRTEVNKQVSQKQALLNEKLSKAEGFNPELYEPFNIMSITNEIDSIQQEITGAETLKAQSEKNKASITDLQSKIDTANLSLAEYNDIDIVQEIEDNRIVANSIKKQIEELQQKLEEVERKIRDWELAQRQCDELRVHIENWQGTIDAIEIKNIPDIEALRVKLAEKQAERTKAIEIEEKAVAWSEAETVRTEYIKVKDEADGLTNILNYLRKDLPAKITKAANIPIDGLKIDGNSVWIGDINMNNMSTSEQMLCGLQMVKKLNEKSMLTVLCVDRLESLDDDSYAVLQDWVAKEDWQVFATSVYHKGQDIPEGAMIVENGEIKEVA